MSGCGGGGSDGDKSRFCRDTSVLGKATAPVGVPDTAEKDAQMLSILKGVQATINDLVKTAPGEIRTDAQLLVETMNAAIKADSMANFGTAGGTGARIAAFCGLNNDGTPIGSTP